MRANVRSWAMIASASAVLASAVVSLLDASAAARSFKAQTSLEGEAQPQWALAAEPMSREGRRAPPTEGPVESPLAIKAEVEPAKSASVVIPQRFGPVEAGRQDIASPRSMRTRVPVGCERLVSVLVRSASANQLGRCVT